MPDLKRSVATLRVAGNDLVPAEITRLLGVQPKRAHSKGDTFTSGKNTYERKIGLWMVSPEDTEPGDLDGQVAELLSITNSDLAVWSELSRRFEIDLFCGWFMQTSNDGIEISAKTMGALSERGIVLSLDIYGPDTELEKSP